MLLALQLTLRSDSDATLPPDLGRAAHALLLSLIRQSDAALAAALHASHEVRPLTCSSLLGAVSHPRGLQVSAGAQYRLRYTALTEATSAALWEATSGIIGGQVRLDRHYFTVTGRQCDAEAFPGTGRTDYDALASLLHGAHAPPTVTLHIASPTAFKSQGLHWPFPTPALLFGSLARRWAAFVPIPLPCDIEAAAPTQIAISAYQMGSEVVGAKHSGIKIGGVGTITYRALSDDPSLRATMQTLAAFATYAGAGIGTTHGMGQLWATRSR